MEDGLNPQPKQRFISIVTVTLPDSDEVEEFRCNKDGTLIKKHKGKRVIQIIEAELLDAKTWDELICRKCKILYRFL